MSAPRQNASFKQNAPFSGSVWAAVGAEGWVGGEGVQYVKVAVRRAWWNQRAVANHAGRQVVAENVRSAARGTRRARQQRWFVAPENNRHSGGVVRPSCRHGPQQNHNQASTHGGALRVNAME